MKVYEYLAAGLPVIPRPCPPSPASRAWWRRPMPQAMAEALDRELAGDGPERRAERSRAASRFSWDTRLEEIDAALPSP